MPPPPSDTASGSAGGSASGPVGATPVEDAPLTDDGRSVYRLEYHFLMVTRRRRPFFADDAMRARAHALMTAIFEENGCRVEDLRIEPSTVRAHVFAPPYLSPHQLVAKLRSVAAPLRREFPSVGENGGLFVRRYIVSHVPAPATACDAFLEGVPTR